MWVAEARKFQMTAWGRTSSTDRSTTSLHLRHPRSGSGLCLTFGGRVSLAGHFPGRGWEGGAGKPLGLGPQACADVGVEGAAGEPSGGGRADQPQAAGAVVGACRGIGAGRRVEQWLGAGFDTL